MAWLVKNSLQRRDALGIFTKGIAGVHVTVESGKIAAGNIDPYAVLFGKVIAGGCQIDNKLVHFTGG